MNTNRINHLEKLRKTIIEQKVDIPKTDLTLTSAYESDTIASLRYAIYAANKGKCQA